jgi:hypothetical protein
MLWSFHDDAGLTPDAVDCHPNADVLFLIIAHCRAEADPWGCTSTSGTLYFRLLNAHEPVGIRTYEVTSMRRIKTLTRPKVNQAYVHQGIVLTLLEKQLRNLLSNLGDTLSKPEEQ